MCNLNLTVLFSSLSAIPSINYLLQPLISFSQVESSSSEAVSTLKSVSCLNDFDSYSLKDIVFNESENAIIAIGEDKNITNSKVDRFVMNNNIRNRSKARTKEQKLQVLLKYRQLDAVFDSMRKKHPRGEIVRRVKAKVKGLNLNS